MPVVVAKLVNHQIVAFPAGISPRRHPIVTLTTLLRTADFPNFGLKQGRGVWLSSKCSEINRLKSFLPKQSSFNEVIRETVMYVVNGGEVEIRLGSKVLEVVGPNGIFGEMAMVDGGPRTATAVARTECKVGPIDQRRFQFLVQQTPFFAIEVMRVLVGRLRRVDELMAAV